MTLQDADTYTIMENRKAYHDYHVIDRFEVGVCLTGSEIRSVRNHTASITGSYVAVLNNELWLLNCSIIPSNHGGWEKSKKTYKRNIKLLCHKKELIDMKYKTEAKGMTIVPLKLYVKSGLIKIEIGLCKGKNNVDKRETLKKRDIAKDIRSSQ